jgi:hypothetical protein
MACGERALSARCNNSFEGLAKPVVCNAIKKLLDLWGFILCDLWQKLTAAWGKRSENRYIICNQIPFFLSEKLHVEKNSQQLGVLSHSHLFPDSPCL